MTDSVVMMSFFFIALMLVYLSVCIVFHNRRLEALEKKTHIKDRREVISRFLAAGGLSVNDARDLLFRSDCTCEDLTTPAYPEFAAVMFDPNCPIHKDKNENNQKG